MLLFVFLAFFVFVLDFWTFSTFTFQFLFTIVF